MYKRKIDSEYFGHSRFVLFLVNYVILTDLRSRKKNKIDFKSRLEWPPIKLHKMNLFSE